LYGCTSLTVKDYPESAFPSPQGSIDSRMEVLNRIAISWGYDDTMFSSTVDVDDFRQTHQGSYAVLPLSERRKLFVFFDSNDDLYSSDVYSANVLVFPYFQTRDEFETEVTEGMSLGDVREMDENTIDMPFSSACMTAHIVQEGVVVVRYATYGENGVLDMPIVESLFFVENEVISSSEDYFIRDYVPYILPQDKVD